MGDIKEASIERRPMTTFELLKRAKHDLGHLRFMFYENEKNLLALIKQYDDELTAQEKKA